MLVVGSAFVAGEDGSLWASCLSNKWHRQQHYCWNDSQPEFDGIGAAVVGCSDDAAKIKLKKKINNFILNHRRISIVCREH